MARHVLVPMDTSTGARKALDFALDQYGDARITVVHVINPLEDTYFASEEEFYTQVDVLEAQAEDRAKEIFDSARDLAAEYECTIETETAIGPPAGTIVETAETLGVDHIVMGSRGRSGVARLLLGSVAEKVARRAPVPVTIIK